MIKTLIICLICIVAIECTGCRRNEKALYRSDTFTVFPDRVEQGKYKAAAPDPDHIISDYASLANSNYKSLIQFKFSLNGRDNEMAFGVNHEASIYPDGDLPVVLDLVFGQKSDLGTDMESGQSLPANTRVRFRVDFTRVLKAFEEKGYYDDVNGNRIFKADFKGLYIAGDTYPLNWDFENLAGKQELMMKDPDGDGIYENELIFNVYDPSAHTASEWQLSNDISKYPRFNSESVLLNALYNMSLDETVMLKEADGTFRTGKEWAGVWTRDISYSIVLAFAFLEPEICRSSLLRKVADNRIIQDTGTGGAWPVSSDRVVWALAAWEIYKYTGDREWLAQAFEIVKNSVEDDRKTILDPATGLVRGESSFLDWRKQTYPLWMEPSNIYASLNLGTNAAYYQALVTLGMMAEELGSEDIWSAEAEQIRKSINRYLWQPDRGYYGQYLYGQIYKSLSPRAEALGEAFTVLFDIADETQKGQVLHNTPVIEYGIPCIYPQIPGIPPYHNNAIWPFVEAFWTLANAAHGEAGAVESGLASIIRPAALFLTNKENFVAETGDFAGTEINSSRQLWSVAAMLAMQYRIIFGMEFEKDKLIFKPLIPESFAGRYSLENFRYRDGTYNISVTGFGDGITSFKLDGKEETLPSIDALMTGNHNIKIIMNGKVNGKPFEPVANYTAPETPLLSVEDERLSWKPVKGAMEFRVYRNGVKWVSTTETFLEITDRTLPAEYQVMAVDSNSIESFLSNPEARVPDTLCKIIEAEDFNLTCENKIEGFTGKGYVSFTLKKKEELNILVKAEKAGSYSLRLRYANGTGPVNTDNNCGIRSLYVNNIYAGSLVFPQRGKDEWSAWGLTNIEWVSLTAGNNHLTIRYDNFNRNMDGEINDFLVDYIMLQEQL
ncbi:MAG TPA: hypothetical protein VMV74_11655 [Bacteroidales bacterium]|nr:hypothetical protein [Bacteroidales bacterium]